jgi:hypothetical protein
VNLPSPPDLDILREYPYSETFPARMSLIGAAVEAAGWRGFPLADIFVLSCWTDAADVDEVNGKPRRSALEVEGVIGEGHCLR